ncbi:MAG: HAMP domain-containing sensor histidine kinase [Aliarcobacter sp.]|nr:HAMP domain-containing sensor histidine kinase [Aliarcobacter sp.]
MKFKSLKTRILFWFGSITFFILLIFSVIFYSLFEKNMYTSFQSKLYKEAIYVKDNLINNKDDIIQKGTYLSSNIAILDNTKSIKKTTDFDMDFILPYLSSESFSLIDNGETVLAIYSLKLDNNLKIIVYQDDIDDNIEDIVDTMLVVEPLLFLALIFLGSKVIDKILIPINNISKSAKSISINNFSNTIPTHKYDDEISELINSFNTMIIRLQEGVSNLDRFNNDVSHELKTPLTVIKGEIEITLNKLRAPDYYINSLNTIDYELNQIENIIENLLLLTKYSKENIKKTFEMTSIDSLLLDTIYSYDAKFKNKNIRLIIDKIESINKEINPLLFKTIFSNLIDNAIKYSGKDTEINISLYKNEKIFFSIKDQGIGISEEKLPFVTDRFYRVDESRNKKIEGFGLGLSIVKNSIDLHNGELEIHSKIKKGTVIEVVF